MFHDRQKTNVLGPEPGPSWIIPSAGRRAMKVPGSVDAEARI